MFELHLLDPVHRLSSRLLVPDSAGLVAERLRSAGLVRITATFVAAGGCAPGGLDRPSRLDSWLKAISEDLLPALGGWWPARRREVPIDAFLREGSAHTCDPPAIAPGVAAGTAAFGAGLAVGVALREEQEGDPIGPPPVLELREVLEMLEGREFDLACPAGTRPLEAALRFVSVVERLLELDPDLAGPLAGLQAVVRQRPGWLWTGSARRLHFLAGLLGAGVVWTDRLGWRCGPANRRARPGGCRWGGADAGGGARGAWRVAGGLGSVCT